MKIRVLSILSLLLIYISCVSAQTSESSINVWPDNKLAMKINFRMPKSHKGDTGKSDPDFAGFNADSIVSIAIESGMRTIISPVKVGNMYLFKTYTDSNSLYHKYNHRDFIKELSDACRKRDIHLGIFIPTTDQQEYSTYPVDDKLNEKVKRQITELLTGYGDISEISFDNGPKSPEMSKELYELVHKLQPECMVGGEAGNGMYDIYNIVDWKWKPRKEFLECNWRQESFLFPPISITDLNEAKSKAKGKIRDMANAVSHGGGFLLNVFLEKGHRVDKYNKEILKYIGHWLKGNGYAIYNTECTPFMEDFDWGKVTRKGNTLYFILSGKYPKDGRIKLHMPEYELEKADGKLATCIQKNGLIDIAIPASAYNSGAINVLILEFKQNIDRQQPEPIRAITLKQNNAVPLYSIHGFDFNTMYKSTVKYSWHFEQLMLKQLEILYTEQEKGKNLEIELDGKTYNVTLNNGKPYSLADTDGIVWGKQYICGPDNKTFHASQTIKTDLENPPVKNSEWKEITIGKHTFEANTFDTYYVMQNIKSPKNQNIIVDAGAGNGIEIYLNGKSIMKHLNPYGCKFRTEKVLLPLQKGNNRIVMRIYNRFEKKISYMLCPSEDQTIYKQELTLTEMSKKKNHKLTVRQSGLHSEHDDTELSNLRIRLRRIAL